jgi:hypothetical protein
MQNGQDSAPFQVPRGLLFFFLALAVVGGIALVVGLFGAPQRAWANLFLVSNFAAWLSLGALVLIALNAVSGARWSLPLLRLQEACVAALPAGALGILVVLVLYPSLYGSADVVGNEPPPSPLRSFWLQRPFLLFRALVYVGAWLAFAVAIIRAARAQEQTGADPSNRKLEALACGFLVAFGVTCWLASNDWIMSLEVGWVSTVFGVYNFAGAFLSALAALTLLAVVLGRCAPLRTFVTPDRLHNLGSLLFGFSSFWMYTWYCQYLLIWYTNHPDETGYLRQREQGVWPTFVLASLILSWGIPFLVLMPRPAKRSRTILALVSLLVLAGRWFDLLVMIGPTQRDALATPGALEAGLALGALGVLGLCAVWSLSRLPLVPAVASWQLDEAPLHPLPATD